MHLHMFEKLWFIWEPHTAYSTRVVLPRMHLEMSLELIPFQERCLALMVSQLTARQLRLELHLPQDI